MELQNSCGACGTCQRRRPRSRSRCSPQPTQNPVTAPRIAPIVSRAGLAEPPLPPSAYPTKANPNVQIQTLSLMIENASPASLIAMTATVHPTATSRATSKSKPQRLKPTLLRKSYGPTKVGPFPEHLAYGKGTASAVPIVSAQHWALAPEVCSLRARGHR